MVDSSTTYFIIASVSAFGGALLKLIYDSKCKNLNICFGCIAIERDTEQEAEIEEARTHQPQRRHSEEKNGENNV